MKTITVFFILLLTAGIFFSCQKAFTPEQNFTSAGTLVKNAAGNCDPVNINGIFKAGVLLGSANYIDVSVHVTATGSYSISTDTLNGFYFSDSADFTSTGTKIVRLAAHGTPVIAGAFAFTAHYNNSSSCAVQVTVSPAGTGPVASFTLVGAPGACTTPIIQGTYTAGTILDPFNRIIVAVNVTALGEYNLTTAVVNGISFSATGTFNILGNQNVVLAGNGMPISNGTNMMSITGTVASCSFPLTVGSVTSSGTYLAAVYQIDTTLSAPFDTIARYIIGYDVQNRVTVITEFDTKPNGDSSFYSVETFSYSGTDTLASQSTEYYREFTSPIYTGNSHSYYAFVNGRCTLDSTVSSTGYYLERFVYNGNTIQKNSTSLNNSTFSYGHSTIYQTLVNGNNAYQLDTSVSYFNINNPGSYHYQREEITTTYTANPNPFFQVKKQVLRPYYYDDIGITSEAAPKNLIVQQNETMMIWNGANPPAVNRQNQLNYTYTFRADGYPTELRYTVVSSGNPTAKGKMIFVYR